VINDGSISLPCNAIFSFKSCMFGLFFWHIISASPEDPHLLLGFGIFFKLRKLSMIIAYSSNLDGFLIEVILDEIKIPKFVPELKKGDPGVCHPRVLVKANGCTHLYNFVKNFLKVNFALIIQSCK
jgi:hypothetical protein